ncbi:MAG: hypothetical protein ACFCUX_08820 [Candidatus Methylacidiphilales bacterium]
MRTLGWTWIGLILCGLSHPVAAQHTPGSPEVPPLRKMPIPEGYVLYVTQPNGWGDTPEAAIKDLRVRILPWYERTFGDRPGFYVDWKWYALVQVADGREWQADGRVGWYVPRATGASSRPTLNPHSRLRTK